MERYKSIFKEQKLNLNFEKVNKMSFSKFKSKYKNKLLNEKEILNNSDEIMDYFDRNNWLDNGRAFFYTGEERPSNKGQSMPKTEVKLAQIDLYRKQIVTTWTAPTYSVKYAVYKA